MHCLWWLEHISIYKHTAILHTLTSPQSYQLHKFVHGVIYNETDNEFIELCTQV